MSTPTREEVLEKDFDPAFVELMKKGLVLGAQKWGLVEQYLRSEIRGDGRPASIQGYRDDVNRLIDDFEATRNPQKLADAANYLLFLYMRATRYPETIVKE